MFLVDLSIDPFWRRREVMGDAVPDLVRRATALAPARVVLISADVYDLAFEPLREARFLVFRLGSERFAVALGG